MPTDTNPMGHVFGGWIMSLMDCAGKMTATHHANGRVVTATVDHVSSYIFRLDLGDHGGRHQRQESQTLAREQPPVARVARDGLSRGRGEYWKGD